MACKRNVKAAHAGADKLGWRDNTHRYSRVGSLTTASW